MINLNKFKILSQNQIQQININYKTINKHLKKHLKTLKTTKRLLRV